MRASLAWNDIHWSITVAAFLQFCKARNNGNFTCLSKGKLSMIFFFFFLRMIGEAPNILFLLSFVLDFPILLKKKKDEEIKMETFDWQQPQNKITWTVLYKYSHHVFSPRKPFSLLLPCKITWLVTLIKFRNEEVKAHGASQVILRTCLSVFTHQRTKSKSPRF